MLISVCPISTQRQPEASKWGCNKRTAVSTKSAISEQVAISSSNWTAMWLYLHQKWPFKQSKYLFANKQIYNWVTEIKINKKVANRAN